MTIFLIILVYVLAFGVMGCVFWLMFEVQGNMTTPFAFLIATASLLVIVIYLVDLSNKIDKCESELPRTQHCEIVIKAVIENE